MIQKIVDKLYLYFVNIQYRIYSLQVRLNNIPINYCYTKRVKIPLGCLEKEGIYEGGEISPILGLLHDIKIINGYSTIYLPEYESSILFINEEVPPLIIEGEIVGINNGKLSTQIFSKDKSTGLFGDSLNILKMTPKFKIRSIRNYAFKIPRMLWILTGYVLLNLANLIDGSPENSYELNYKVANISKYNISDLSGLNNRKFELSLI